MVAPYLHAPIRLHGVMLNSLRTTKKLPCYNTLGGLSNESSKFAAYHVLVIIQSVWIYNWIY
jgi:hypothetical protein